MVNHFTFHNNFIFFIIENKMGRDTDRLQIVSMNASGRKGRQFMDYRKSYLDDIIGNNEPDVIFLPGDEPDMSSSALTDYRQAQVAHNNDTVLLYDSKRLRLKTPDWYGFIPSLVVPGIDIDKLMYPLVDILSPPPTQYAVKQFHCISWHWELTQTTTDARYKFAWRYVWLAQYLAWSSGVEVLIGGDFNLPVEQIEKLLTDHNKLVEQSIDDVKPFFQEMGYMDCMTETAYRPGRRLRQLKLHKSKTLSTTQDADYFVASKEMQLFKTEMIANSKLPGRCTTMTMTKPAAMEYRATKTEMNIPNRPPRHNGG
jgi:hypothetical protein